MDEPFDSASLARTVHVSSRVRSIARQGEIMKRRAMMIVAGIFGIGTAMAQAPTTAPVAASAEAAAEKIIYDKALAEGWQNWSWAKTTVSAELAGSARKPIKVEASPWSALYLHHAPFSTQGWTKLAFLIQGSAAGGEVRAFALVDGKIASDGYPIKLGNAGWTQVEIPLVTLGVENKLTDGIWVQNTSGTELPKFYVTEIKLK
jgi:hypothetical protein